MRWLGGGYVAEVLRRRRAAATGFPPQWREVLTRYCAPYRRLDPAGREQLEAITLDLVADKRWDATVDLELTDEMIVVVAGHAAVPVLTLGVARYRRVRTILLARGAMTSGTPRPGPAAGTVLRRPSTIIGEAHPNGLVRLSWPTVRSQSLWPRSGQHVVIHEFAHQLDMLDGIVDGTPPLAADAVARWTEVCDEHLSRVRRGDGVATLRTYAGSGPGEFFAVATEAFFTVPERLVADAPDLYGVLADYFGQDPASWSPG